jgi:hypothetical protein
VPALATSATMTITSYAICAARHLSLSLPFTVASFDIPAGSRPGWQSSYPAGQLLTGGGFGNSGGIGVDYSTDSPASASERSPTPITRWLVGGSNTGSGRDTVFISVVCATFQR